MDDPGNLVQIGFSAGSRHAPNFDWARNITRKDLPKEVITDFNYRSSSAFALFWNLCKDALPREIIGSFHTFFEENDMLHMNPADGAAKDFANGENHLVTGDYTIQIGDEKFVFKNVELAPPSGVFGRNYARLAFTFLAYISILMLFLEPCILNTNPTSMRWPGQSEETIHLMQEVISTSALTASACRLHPILLSFGNQPTSMEQACKTLILTMKIPPSFKQASPS